MKKFLSITAASVLLTATLTSCQKEEVINAAPVTAAGNTMSETANLFRWMAENGHAKNMGNGAVLVREVEGGLSFSVGRDLVFDPSTFMFTSGEIAGFGAQYGANDFKRYNPDGSVSIHLVSNAAEASYENLGAGEVYLGTGNSNFKFTGFEETVEVPFPPFTMTFLMPDTTKAFVVQGRSQRLTLNGEPGTEHSLRMKWLETPGGQGGADFTFN